MYNTSQRSDSYTSLSSQTLMDFFPWRVNPNLGLRPRIKNVTYYKTPITAIQ
jgi:hypothetical protein